MANCNAMAVENEMPHHIGLGTGNGGTEHSELEREAEAQHEDDGRSGTSEKDGGDSCPVESSFGEKDRAVKKEITHET